MPGTWAALLDVYMMPRTALLREKKIYTIEKDKTIAKHSRIKEKKQWLLMNNTVAQKTLYSIQL